MASHIAVMADVMAVRIEAVMSSVPAAIIKAKGNWGPVATPALVRNPFAPDADPAGKEIPLMIGSNATEATFFNSTPLTQLDEAGLNAAFEKGNFTAKIPVDKIDALIARLAAEIDLKSSTREIDDLLAALDPAEWHPDAQREVLVNYLGFPGTMGAEYIDYIIAATAFVHEADLLTPNVRHFPMFEGLRPPWA
jgi:hypothetical protein